MVKKITEPGPSADNLSALLKAGVLRRLQATVPATKAAVKTTKKISKKR